MFLQFRIVIVKIGLYVLLLYANLFSYGQNKVAPINGRVDPPFWWEGMSLDTLELMIYSKDLSKLDEVAINKTSLIFRKEGDFLQIKIPSKFIKVGHLAIHFLGDKLRQLTYDIKKREEKSIEAITQKDVIYLITPDRFCNADSTNDNIQNYPDKVNREDEFGRHGGDIEGIIQKLDYIKSMGFTAIWLNPILENNMLSSSYHGYSTTNFYAVDPRFGSNSMYKKMVSMAKEKGIKVIMDVIPNHMGLAHWWFQNNIGKNWINNFESKKKTNHAHATSFDPYRSAYDYELFKKGWFVDLMPDINQDNKTISKYLIQNAIWWVEYAGLSGFRIDTYPYMSDDFGRAYTCALIDQYPNFWLVGEEWSLSPNIINGWIAKSTNKSKGCMTSMMDFPLQNALVQALVHEENWNSGWRVLYECMAQDFVYEHPQNQVIFADNHDMDRIFTQLNGDIDLMKMAMVFLYTTRGIPQVFYGTEALLDNAQHKGNHGHIRAEMPGGWNDHLSSIFTNTVDGKTKEWQKFMANLGNWRKTEFLIHHGKLMHFFPENGIYVFFRYLPQKKRKIMVVMSKKEEEVALDLSAYKEMLENNKNYKNVFTGLSLPLGKSIKVPQKSAQIFEIN